MGLSPVQDQNLFMLAKKKGDERVSQFEVHVSTVRLFLKLLAICDVSFNSVSFYHPNAIVQVLTRVILRSEVHPVPPLIDNFKCSTNIKHRRDAMSSLYSSRNVQWSPEGATICVYSRAQIHSNCKVQLAAYILEQR